MQGELIEKVYCPVADKDIDSGDCIIICDVADKMIKPTVLPEGVQWDENQRKKCLNCEWHNYE